MVRNLLYWLASLFHIEVVWVDKGQGKWVKRRRYHPVIRGLLIVMTLTVCITWSVNFFHNVMDSGEAQRAPSLPADPSRTIEFNPNNFFPELTSIDTLPGPIPIELNVDDNEYWVRINKRLYMLYLYRGDEVEKTYEIAVGKNPGNKERVGDNRTPNGIFTVQSIENASSWSHDFRDGKGVIRGAYGPWFIRLRTGWKGIGIHGTHDPNSRGSMVSEGCIRMLNDELEELRRFTFRNMKVVIEE
ncbi:MAG: L,D-transpeptidase [Synergistaceae bacterium]|jgi:lipoprotein-anchoring transpeptidase ErfK/SrfK|nr:L,D-transpeptidase [Synergistaceae bacterium]